MGSMSPGTKGIFKSDPENHYFIRFHISLALSCMCICCSSSPARSFDNQNLHYSKFLTSKFPHVLYKDKMGRKDALQARKTSPSLTLQDSGTWLLWLLRYIIYHSICLTYVSPNWPFRTVNFVGKGRAKSKYISKQNQNKKILHELHFIMKVS